MTEETIVPEAIGDHSNELQITKVVVCGQYGDGRPYEEVVNSNVIIGEGDGCTLNLTVVNAYVVRDDEE